MIDQFPGEAGIADRPDPEDNYRINEPVER
jgi:hypothetical protein